jgi:four helix bundle protein
MSTLTSIIHLQINPFSNLQIDPSSNQSIFKSIHFQIFKSIHLQIVFMQNNKGQNMIVVLSFDFALKIIQFAERLEEKRRYVIGRQILKSGTSVGANIREAQNAESRADFIHKLKIAAKEADETEYWLLLCKESYDVENCELLIEDCRVIIKVLSKIIASSKRKSNQSHYH